MCQFAYTEQYFQQKVVFECRQNPYEFGHNFNVVLALLFISPLTRFLGVDSIVNMVRKVSGKSLGS